MKEQLKSLVSGGSRKDDTIAASPVIADARQGDPDCPDRYLNQRSTPALSISSPRIRSSLPAQTATLGPQPSSELLDLLRLLDGHPPRGGESLATRGTRCRSKWWRWPVCRWRGRAVSCLLVTVPESKRAHGVRIGAVAKESVGRSALLA
jgi:hypothetical protein